MSYFSKYEVELANTHGLTPLQIRGIITAYDILSGFGFVKTKEQLDSLIVEESIVIDRKRKYIYRELPAMVTKTVRLFLDKGKKTNSFYCEALKKKNLPIFIKTLKTKKIQPREFYYRGILTCRHSKREVHQDYTYEVKHQEIEYRHHKEAA